MNSIIIKNGLIVNRGKSVYGDILVRNDRIEKIDDEINQNADREFDATGLWVIPGIIDDQVHFREPGLTHKATIETESKAAIAGGVTSYMEMPNTKPPCLTQKLLEQKYEIAAATSAANFSFYMGASNENLEQVLKTDPRKVCGVKIFMGSSTGNMLVDDRTVLENLFANVSMLIATHCEDEETIRKNNFAMKAQYGADVPTWEHPYIRSTEACFLSSSLAVELAKKHGTRLHILHLTTRDELPLLEYNKPLAQKQITAEVCVHHLFYNSDDYQDYGNLIKCNPAIKSRDHQEALYDALMEGRLDVIATDHAPHTWTEKSQPYLEAPSGLPLIQHGLVMMLDFYHRGLISREQIVEKMCHNPAIAFQIENRGFLDEGARADIALVAPEKSVKIEKSNIQYKCAWSPLEGKNLKGRVQSTIVNGRVVFHKGKYYDTSAGERMTFERA